MLRYLSVQDPAKLLDWGCGPGRDLVTFKDHRHYPNGLGGSEAFAEMAREITGEEVLHPDFIALILKPDCEDGAFANASLFRIPMCEIQRVLGEIFAALRNGDVLSCSPPPGPEYGAG